MAKKCPNCNSKNTDKFDKNTTAQFFTDFDGHRNTAWATYQCRNCGNYFK